MAGAVVLPLRAPGGKLRTLTCAMPTLQPIRRILRQFRRLPRAIMTAFHLRRQAASLNALEVERLDRIRNPSKYRGK
jgi:hypothetical protein